VAERRPDDAAWLADVARDACRDVGDVPIELLGDYLRLLADAATSGRKPDAAELDAVDLLGRRAAELGVSAGSAVQLYLSAARLRYLGARGRLLGRAGVRFQRPTRTSRPT
jgi:hypothetical protein